MPGQSIKLQSCVEVTIPGVGGKKSNLLQEALLVPLTEVCFPHLQLTALFFYLAPSPYH